ncbi:partial Methylaspartate ammonia-lyase, partial [Gammaproteobacteria bacterium]
GGDSIAGTIVAETPAPVFAEPGQGTLAKGEIGAYYRSNGNAMGGNVSATFATESFSIAYAGATAESDNYRAGRDFKTSPVTGREGHTLPLDEVGSTAYKSRNHELGIAFKGGAHLVEAKVGYQEIPYQLWPNQRMDMLDNVQQRLNLRYRGVFGWGTLEARAWREDVEHFVRSECCDLIQIKMPDLGGVDNTIEASLECHRGNVGVYLGGSCNETDISARVAAHVALAVRPTEFLAKPGLGVDEGVMIVTNEMARAIRAYGARATH